MSVFNRYGPAFLIVAFIILGLVYDFSTPVFEKPDEAQHFFYVVHLARGGGLPNHKEASEALWAQEGSQPPLYYALAAALVRSLDLSRAERLAERNPHAAIGIPTWPSNKNVYLHPPGEQGLDSSEVLAVHLARWLSLAAGAVTVWATWRLANEVLAGSGSEHSAILAWGAAALVAFSPQFLFISSSASNDALTAMAASIALWLLVRALRVGLTWGEGVALALAAGGAALSKVSGLLVLPFGLVLLGGAVIAGRGRSLRPGRLSPMALAGLLLAGVALVAGWWYVRNWWLYGDPTGFNAMIEVAGARERSPSWSRLRWEFSGVLISYWALFGWFNILAEEWAYRLLNLFMLIAALGLPLAGLRFWRQGRAGFSPADRDNGAGASSRGFWPSIPAVPVRVAIMLAWFLTVLLALLRWTHLTTGSQGRLLFPAIGAVAVLLIVGSTAWLPRRWWQPAVLAGAAALGFWAASLPPRAIAPAYALPPRLSEDALPAEMTRLDWRYGPVRLLGYTLTPGWVDRSTPFDLTLFWQTDHPLGNDYSVGVKLFGRHDELIAREDTYPGGGLYPTGVWQPGEVVVDRHRIWVSGKAERPVAGELWVDLYDRETLQALPVTDASGQSLGVPAIARLKVAPKVVDSDAKPDPEALIANLNGELAIVSADLGSTRLEAGQPLTMTLTWTALQTPPADYTLFVHLVPESGPLQPLAQVDRQPLDGDYPTSFWTPGEVVTDTLRLDLPAALDVGTYRLVAGLYNLATQQRLPVLGGGDSVSLAVLQFDGNRWEIATAYRDS